MCRHRGMQVCRAEAGHASTFRCPYHAWTYRNDGRLVGVPFHHEAYGGDAGLDKTTHGLVTPAARRHLPRPRLRQPRPAGAAARGRPRRLPRSSSTSTSTRARTASSCGGRSAGVCGATGRSAPRTSPATRTTRPTPTRAWSTSACSASRPPTSARKVRCTSPAAVAARPTSCPVRATSRATWPTSATHPRWSSGCARRGRRSSRPWSAPGGFMVSAATAFPNLSFVHNWPQDPTRRGSGAVHLRAAVAAGQRDRDRVPTRGSPSTATRPRLSRTRLVQGLPDVLRLLGHVRAGRRRELDVDHERGQGPARVAGRAGQHDGHGGRAAAPRPTRPARGPAPGTARRRLRRVQPAGVARLWARANSAADRERAPDRRAPAGRSRSSCRRTTTWIAAVARLGGRAARRPALPGLAALADRRRPLPDAGDPVTLARGTDGGATRHGSLRRGPVLVGEAGRAARRRPRLDGGSAVADPALRDQRPGAHPGPTTRSSGPQLPAALPQPRATTVRPSCCRPSAPIACGPVDGDWRLVSREIAVDDAVLRMQNLAVFL